MVNQVNSGFNVINLLYIFKLRENFNRIKQFSDNSKKRGNNLFILHSLQLKKANKYLRDAFTAIKNKKINLVFLTNQLSNIVNNVNKNKLFLAFCKIGGFKGTTITKPAQSTSSQPQRSKIVSKI